MLKSHLPIKTTFFTGPLGYTFQVVEPTYKDQLCFKDHILLIPRVAFIQVSL